MSEPRYAHRLESASGERVRTWSDPSVAVILEPMEIRDRAGVLEPERRAVEAAMLGLTCLADVIRWGMGAEPARPVVDVIVQDEYTHDVVLEYGRGIFLVFDTT